MTELLWDHQPWSNGDGRVTIYSTKSKVYSLSEDRILNIKPSNLTIVTEEKNVSNYRITIPR